MDAASSVFSSSSEPCAPTSTSGSAPPSSSPVPLAPERPGPGSFRYLPPGTQWTGCSKNNPGDPTGHFVLILPCEVSDLADVKVVFATTKDVVGYTSSKRWACSYVPLEGQSHPWRDAIPLAQGCVAFPKPTSINVYSTYTVAWRHLEDVNFTSPGMSAPCLSAEVLEKVMEYVRGHEADLSAPWKIVPPRVQAKNMAGLRNSGPITTAPAPAPAPAPASVLVSTPVAAMPSVPAQNIAQAYVPPFLRPGYLPPAAVFDPAASWRQVQQNWMCQNWRRPY